MTSLCLTKAHITKSRVKGRIGASKDDEQVTGGHNIAYVANVGETEHKLRRKSQQLDTVGASTNVTKPKELNSMSSSVAYLPRVENKPKACYRNRYSTSVLDTKGDFYRVHKWRLRSGSGWQNDVTERQRSLQQRLGTRQSIDNTKVAKNLHLTQLSQSYITNRVDKNTKYKGTLQEKEQQFCSNMKMKRQYKLGRVRPTRQTLLGNLRHSMHEQLAGSDHLVHLKTREKYLEDQSTFENDGVESARYMTNLPRRYSKLPAITRISSLTHHPRTLQNKSKITTEHGFSPSILIRHDDTQNIDAGRRNTMTEMSDNFSENQSKPSNKKLSISFSRDSFQLDSQEGGVLDTPDNLSTRRYSYAKQKARALRTRSKTESNSPQFYPQIKQVHQQHRSNISKWRTAARLSVWLARLCKAHSVTVDDSYNIQQGFSNHEDTSSHETKKDILFDVTNYKMKNQYRLSDSTRKILNTPSPTRTSKDINQVKTALRNIKAISDYSESVQHQIARCGYFAGFMGKRVVVREGRKPLNYFVLLAGSAVVIKTDEFGNTSPVLFLQKGDVFGEHEILEGINWRWNVATVGYCEFLVLGKDDYKKIFIEGGGGGILSDPDRGEFLRSISLLKKWPRELLNENPNRCLFRYFKRGAVLSTNSYTSEWIYVVKSGSCSVLKTIESERMKPSEVLRRTKEEQMFKLPDVHKSQLVEKMNDKDDDHLKKLSKKEEESKNQAKDVSVYQQLEMSSILKQLNTDVLGMSFTPRADMNETDRQSDLMTLTTIAHQESDKDEEKLGRGEEFSSQVNFSLERNSDLLRTPSPMKTAYLRTGQSSRSNNSEKGDNKVSVVAMDGDVTQVEQLRQEHVVEFTGKDDVFHLVSRTTTEQEMNKVQLPPVVHLIVRKLTKGGSFALESILYTDQPQLSLVSNGAECLMLNKKLFLENSSEYCLDWLRQKEYPYPTDEELKGQYWRLRAWKAYQTRLLKQICNEMQG
nr:uncharacterized protein LOC104265749 isoform X1 [Ciona intestinalis]|eukprot:XP_009858722.2 uncharacterized protein LOC104265749 isoform X1 [Ciona intestinalis]